MKGSLIKIVRVFFALALLALLLLFVDLKSLWITLSNVTLLSVMLLAALAALLILVSAIKWRCFLQASDSQTKHEAPSLSKLFGLYLIGYFINSFLPSFVGGDVLRSYYAGKHVGQHQAAAATILERYTGLVAMVFLSCICLSFSSLVTWQMQVMVLSCGFGVEILTWLALWPKFLTLLLLPSRLGGSRYAAGIEVLSTNIRKVQLGFELASKNVPLLFKALGLSLLFHSLTVVNTLAAAHAVGWVDPPLIDLFVVLPLILLIGAVPFSPNGLGIQEGAFFYFLHGIGATPEQALGVALVLRAKSFVLAVIGGVVMLAMKKNINK